MQELSLSTPEFLRNTYKLSTSGVGGNCFFSALSQQPPFVNNQTALELRLAFQAYVLRVGVKTVYSNICFPFSVVIHGEGLR